MKLILLVLFLHAATPAIRNTYEGWKLFRIWPDSQEMVGNLAILYETALNIDFWTVLREPGQPVDVAVAEIAHPSFENILYVWNVTHEIEMERVDKTLNKERKDMKLVGDVDDGEINFKTYHRYDKILAYLNKLNEKYDTVKLETIGDTYEGREIKVVKISSGKNNPAILIDSAIIPREWIGPAQSLYIIHKLVEDPDYKDLIENVDWYIIPVTNPDGYEYTHTMQRLWKKNRSKTKAKHTHDFGVCIDRNFDVNWGQNQSSTKPDEWMYQGEKAFSELESLAIKTFVERNENVELYLSIRSFGPKIVYPYAYTTEKPENTKLYQWLGRRVAAAIAENSGSLYRVRSASGKRFVYSGTSVDWVVKSGVNLGYVLELPSAGYTGFDFPIAKIEGVVKEIMPGLRVFHDYVVDKFYETGNVNETEIEAEEIIEDIEEVEKDVEGESEGNKEADEEIITENEVNDKKTMEKDEF